MSDTHTHTIEVLHTNLQVYLQSAPFTQDETDNKHIIKDIVFLGLVFLIAPVLIPTLNTTIFLTLSMANLFLILSLVHFTYALYLSMTKKIVTFYQDKVVIYSKSILKGNITTTLPYSAFKGVLMGNYIFETGYRGSIKIACQTIDLVHENKAFTVKLYDKIGTTPPRALWKEYIALMRVPALLKNGDNIETQNHDEINLSLQQREKLTNTQPRDFSPHNIPQGLEITHKKGLYGDHTHIKISTNRLTLTNLALLALIPAFLIAMPFFAGDTASYIFPVVAFLILWMHGDKALQDHYSKREIVITPSEIIIKDGLPKNKHKKTVSKLAFSDIENIVIQGKPMTLDLVLNNFVAIFVKGDSVGQHLLIIGKEGEMSTNTGLSKQTLEWLQNYLRANIVTP